MSNKSIGSLVVLGIIAIFGIICFTQTLHVNDVQNLQVIQSITGEVIVRKDAGWYSMLCPRIWTYPKAGIYRLNAKDKDLLDIQFNNKSTAKLRANIGYRIDTASNEVIIALHQQVESDDEKIWTMILTALNTAAQSITTKYDPSDVIGGDKFEPLIREIYKAIMHNPELLKHGIDVNYFAVDGRPIPDDDTQKQFANQREADLSRRLAEAEKIKLEAEKLKVEAQYAREIAEFKGKADAETAKLKTEAEREKELATIAAQQKVEVEKLEKEQMLVKASRELEVAEISKQTEAKQLEIIEIKAKQQIAQAEAKRVAIEKSGAITELQQAEIELQRQVAEYKWKAIGQGISSVKLPSVLTLGAGDGKTSTNPLDNLINTLTVEKLGSLTKPTVK